MPNYLCLTGGLVMNGKKYKAGCVYFFPKNPAEEHFKLHSEYPEGKREPRFGQSINVTAPVLGVPAKKKGKKKE